MDAFYTAIKELPSKFVYVLEKISPNIAEKTTEIRIRAGCPITLTLVDGFTYLLNDNNKVITDKNDVDMCFMALCAYSVYSVENCISSGYIPLKNGNRAGICGKGIIQNGKLKVSDISSINLRISRNFANNLNEKFVNILQKPYIGMIIAGAPSSGKTTILKSIIKQLSHKQKRTAIIDERCELSCLAPLEHCDFLYAYPKAEGMMQAIRSLSPQIIVCDELGAIEDVRAVEESANAGVGLIVSIHVQSYEAMFSRPQSKALLQTGAFNTICVLKGANMPCEIERIIENDNNFKADGSNIDNYYRI